ncbi:substrate-binding domain-containing protein [Marinirhabdus gelatinilytica]|uniref:ABC-type nitrate/sulfonate/bicarbonate transport system substrate-binding protein n=1 Tax=Marinirhabdus gelatinilytica TaxID=1703343 RepID=A0A370Q9X7_9FLAO|nr:substrate-binding domain-containing protein [Marinirhabdus gelatinilytica]RDK85191.1 ABC-type nitrate/sulfonate/bicarbonate transport system substrate-binding protein [Marinirhabdus gelatinilytica]
MKKIKIGGVPEHFNLPWYITLKNKEYHEHDINLRWIDYHGGTGQMNKALREGEIDMAVILTEGIIRDIVNGNPSKIVQGFVQSPLLWGIHVAENSRYENISDLKGTDAAISRFGSGSHLMAYVNAENQGWDLEKDLNFEVIKNLEGALEELPKGNGDYFMWEKFTTKPYVDNGPFRRVGECPTPWPCFVIAVRDQVLRDDAYNVNTILEIINRTTSEFKDIPSIDRMISNRYNQQLDDVQEWLSLTEWSQQQLTSAEIERVQEKLLQLELIEKNVPVAHILR